MAGSLRKKRGGRGARPVSVKHSMHLVLRSTQATGEHSFRRRIHEKKIVAIIKRFSEKYAVRVISFANAGNHLHLQIHLGSRLSYKPFIRAITGSIAQAVLRTSRVRKSTNRFWDERPFTRITQGFHDRLRLADYIEINALEGFGINRHLLKVYRDLSRPTWSG